MQLANAAALFLGEYSNPGTVKAYRSALDPLVEALGPVTPITEIRPANLIAYGQQLASRDYSDATYTKHVKAIRTFFNWLVKVELIATTPARALRQKRLRKYVSRDKAMTDEELKRVLDYAKWFPRNYALILFLADTGCRAGGAASLKVKDLDLENCAAIVTEKGNKTRPVAYGQQCAQALRLWLLRRPHNAGEYVFSKGDSALTSAVISQILRRICLRVGVRSLGSHSLRHRKGHQFADARVAPSIASTALGHEDVNTTLTNYYPADWETAAKELRKLAESPSAERGKIVFIRRSKGD